ncbi:MAG: hypothetical protein KGJ13_12700 [Patescibacteria group bacterium]|nr:hypothetical protein [Patescibacteria group bacterium]
MELYLAARIIFILLDAALGLGLIYVLMKVWHYRPHFDIKHSPKGKGAVTLRSVITKERWNAILEKFSLGTPESERLAVIEADALVDSVLKAMEVPGEHLADRISNLDTEDLKSINKLWAAHRLRNDLVHTTGFVLGPGEAKVALANYEAFLRELGMLAV